MSERAPDREPTAHEMFTSFFRKLLGRDFVTALVVIAVIVLVTLPTLFDPKSAGLVHDYRLPGGDGIARGRPYSGGS